MPTPPPLHLLLVTDQPSTAEGLVHAVRQGCGCAPTWYQVQTQRAFLSRLDAGLDLILADDTLAQLNAWNVLQSVRERGLDIPIIVVGETDHVDEAVRWLQQGAADYVPHDHLDRLGLAVRRAMAEHQKRAERLQTDLAYRAREQRWEALIEHTAELIALLDADGRYRYVSPSYQRVLGYAPAALLGQMQGSLIHPDDAARVARVWQTAVRHVGVTDIGMVRLRHVDGSWRWLELGVTNRLAEPSIKGVVANACDVTERIRAEEALQHQALHDALTDLPNRTLLQDRLQQALLASRRSQQPLALLLLDLDRFKEVNDTFGHHHGDALLQQATARLRATLRLSDTVARLGGDEFAVLLPGTDRPGAQRAAERIRTALDTPFVVEGQSLEIAASIGIALAPEHGQDADTLLRRADVAMYVAKYGDEAAAVYSPDQDEYSPDRLALIADLRHAIAQGELLLHYQPQVEMRTGRICGVEALVRWQHPQRGLVRPDQFIRLAEQTGLIAPLTRWVVDAAVQQCATWHHAGLELPVAVNLSTRNLQDPHLPRLIARPLHTHDLPATHLRLEVTESALMADATRAQEVLADLAALGIGISVDDYGTGYSSLAYLKRLPVDELKIDMTFVRAMTEDAADAVIVRSTVELGHNLGLRVVAEGVEDRQAWDKLVAMGCDTGQGYYIGRPVPASDVVSWLQEIDRLAA